MRNYLKVTDTAAAHAQFFFFDDENPRERAVVWSAALRRALNEPERVAIWHADSLGRYPGEQPGVAHPIVKNLAPISPLCRVIGIPFGPPSKAQSA